MPAIPADLGQHICRPRSAHRPTRVGRSADQGRQVAKKASLLRHSCRLRLPFLLFGVVIPAVWGHRSCKAAIDLSVPFALLCVLHNI